MGDTNKRLNITYKDVDDLEAQQLEAVYGKEFKFMVALPTSITFPSKFVDIAGRILNFKICTDDIWILAYPRTGSNWVQEMIWLIDNDLNFEEAKKKPLAFRSALVEGTAMAGHLYGEWGKQPENLLEEAKNAKSPRHIKTHLPWNFAPIELNTVKPKIIYVARNPKDVCVSYYKLLKLTMNLQIPFDIFCELFLAGKVAYGSYFEHLLTYWKLRHELNFLFLKFEDMKKDLEGSIRKTAEFLRKDISESNITRLVDHLSFKNMKINPAVNKEDVLRALNTDCTEFIRKGEVGDWKNHMRPDIAEKFDAMIKECLEANGLSFE